MFLVQKLIQRLSPRENTVNRPSSELSEVGTNAAVIAANVWSRTTPIEVAGIKTTAIATKLSNSRIALRHPSEVAKRVAKAAANVAKYDLTGSLIEATGQVRILRLSP